MLSEADAALAALFLRRIIVYSLLMKTVLALIVVLALAAAAYWYFTDAEHKRQVEHVQDRAAQGAEEMGKAVKERLKDFHLTTPEIKEELERTGQVVRKKAEAVGAAIADATADTRITTIIKAKLVKDPDLSAIEISVSTTAGVVTLSGSVASPEYVSRAMKLALETDGVSEVISTLQVKAAK